MKKIEELMARQREVNERLGVLDGTLQERELTADEKKEQSALVREYEKNKRSITLGLQEEQSRSMKGKAMRDANAELREFILNAKHGKGFDIPMNREAMTYGGTGGTGEFVQGITLANLINTDRKDGDILVSAGVPMMTGVGGYKIQWPFAGGVEAAFANELEASTERKIDLDKQSPVMQRLTVKVRISNQALENSTFDLQGYIVKQVSEAIRNKINFAAASTTKATGVFFGGFAQDTETGTYGAAGYVAGKQTGSYTSFTAQTAAEMVGKLASRNLPLDHAVFVMGGEDFWKLKVTPFDEGSGIMLIGNDNRLLGLPVVVCNAINRTTEKGAASGHNIGLGNFAYMPVMQHGNIRLSVDSASAYAAGTDEVITTINADFSMTVLKDGADAFVLYSKSNA